jgi:sugar lactone lactonase YvrE
VEIQCAHRALAGSRPSQSAGLICGRVGKAFLGIGVVLAILVAGAFTSASAQTAVFSGGQTEVGHGFQYPVGVTVSENGIVYVADEAEGIVVELLSKNGSVPNNPTMRTLNLSGSGIVRPWGVVVDKFGDLYVSDWTTNSIYEFVAVNGTIPNTPAIRTIASGFAGPYGLAVDKSGNLYVGDYFHHQVKEILAVSQTIPDSPTIRTLGSGFVGPKGIAVDSSGDVFVADYTSAEVDEMVAVSGSVPDNPTINVIGSGWSQPDGVAIDSSGNLYVTDLGANKLFEVWASGGTIPTSPTITSIGYRIINPFSVTIDSSGNIYVGWESISIPKLQVAGWNFGQGNVGAYSIPVTLTFNFTGAAVLGSIKVQTTGTSEIDFANGGSGTCAATTSYQAGSVCTVNVAFNPKSAGAKTGTVSLLDASSNVIASAPLQGTGVAVP